MNTNYAVKYLKEIEKTIATKINLVKEPSELLESKQHYYDEVLKIYQEAFTRLIEYSVTFSKLLNEINKAYRNALHARDERISLFITQDKVFGVSQKKRERDDQMKKLINENEELKKLNLILTSDKTELKKEIDKCAVFGGSGDGFSFASALQNREQLSATQSKLKKMIDDYSDTVPRREYDVLENKHNELNKKLDTLKTEYEALENCYRRVVAQKKSLQEELSEIKERCRELERAGTPRPQWEICADFIAGGRDRWWQLARGLSSRDILMVLLKELGPAAETEHLEYFDGLGTDPAIPPYLRYEGKVRNLRLSRRELSIVINDIWNSKLENGRHVPMQDYVTQYFEERYAAAGVRAEWAYNVCAGARRALDEPQLRLFCGTLLAALSEDVYWAHREAYHALKADLYRHARDGETITLEEFEKVAKSTFPLKSEVDIKNLSDVVRKQLKMKINHNVVNLDNLFLENEEGFDRLDIARELFRQRQLAQDKYIREIVAELGGRRASNKCISVDNLKRAFAIVDPAIDHIRMERNIRWAFSNQTSELNSISPIPLRTLVARLAAGNIERVGPRYKGMHRRTFYK